MGPASRLLQIAHARAQGDGIHAGGQPGQHIRLVEATGSDAEGQGETPGDRAAGASGASPHSRPGTASRSGSRAGEPGAPRWHSSLLARAADPDRPLAAEAPRRAPATRRSGSQRWRQRQRPGDRRPRRCRAPGEGSSSPDRPSARPSPQPVARRSPRGSPPGSAAAPAWGWPAEVPSGVAPPTAADGAGSGSGTLRKASAHPERRRGPTQSPPDQRREGSDHASGGAGSRQDGGR
jgi:hypothetical protein